MSQGTSVANSTRLVTTMAIVTLVALVVALIGVRSGYSQKTALIALDTRGVPIPVVPLNKQIFPDSRVIQFAEECIRKSFSHDFLHFGETIPEAQDCFTPDVGDEYVRSMDGYIKLMKDRRMVMAVTVARPSRVLRVYKKQTQFGEGIAWDMESAVDIYFEGRSERIPPQRNKISMTVIRVPLEENPRGILIDKFFVGPDAPK